MCRPTTCRRCGNTTWAGCGQHVDQVMGQVPKQERCTCEGDAGRARQPRTGSDREPSRLRRLLRR